MAADRRPGPALAEKRRPRRDRHACRLRDRLPADQATAGRDLRVLRRLRDAGAGRLQWSAEKPLSRLPEPGGQRRGAGRRRVAVLAERLARRGGHGRGRVRHPVLRGDQRLLRRRGNGRGAGLHPAGRDPGPGLGDPVAAGRVGAGRRGIDLRRHADLAAAGRRYAAPRRRPRLPRPGRPGRLRLRGRPGGRAGSRPRRPGRRGRTPQPAGRLAAPADRADRAGRRARGPDRRARLGARRPRSRHRARPGRTVPVGERRVIGGRRGGPAGQRRPARRAG